ncbi:MAG: hypothetical protein JSW52_08870 [Candidatus Coatesbacteria bacterium]|nr:MAG: hypothetical protein JSW52_08870 [Candidatus Coatesbacteria bacterium]
MPKKKSDEPIGEVLGSRADAFSGELLTVDDVPSVGTVVRAAGDPDVFGVISSLETDTALPGRSPARYGLPPDELLRQHPELAELITTRFEAPAVGRRSGDAVVVGSPGKPVPLYTPVYRADAGDVIALGDDRRVVRLLAASDAGADDGFLLAAVVNLADARSERAGFLEDVCRELSRLLAGDYLRLEYILGSLDEYYGRDKG